MKLRSSVNFGLLFLFQTFLGLDLGGGGGNRRGIMFLVVRRVIKVLVVAFISVGGDDYRLTVIQRLTTRCVQIMNCRSGECSFRRRGPPEL